MSNRIIVNKRKEEILGFVKQTKAKDHVIMFYTNPREKYHVLFTYLKAGLDAGDAAAYVAGDESPNEIREAMKEFGLDVEHYEKNGALRIIDYRAWYIIKGEFNADKMISVWKKLLGKVKAKGFKGLRVTGEVDCFIKHGMVKRLLEYEKSLHKALAVPSMVISACNFNMMPLEAQGELYLDLINAHKTIIFSGPDGGIVKRF
jgi:hypothetical protein